MIFNTFIICVILCIQYTFSTTVLVVLGSSDNSILDERVTSTIQYIENNNSDYILFVSGGVKHAFMSGDDTEACKMSAQISAENEDIQIVMDENARNTAENFVNLKKWMNSNFDENDLPRIVISTSDFHKKRAESIFKGILPDIVPTWNLSESKCSSCWNDERIHMRNVQNDIRLALINQVA
jgi:uncharacterized SAM-binding protein YcdF (DUF218 family)